MRKLPEHIKPQTKRGFFFFFFQLPTFGNKEGYIWAQSSSLAEHTNPQKERGKEARSKGGRGERKEKGEKWGKGRGGGIFVREVGKGWN